MSKSTAIHLYSLDYSEGRTYLYATLFIIGNILVPRLCHLIPQGGLMLLPIYFFTLIAAYKFGWKVGLLTAVVSPLANSLLFAMPAPSMLPVIMVKSVLLALCASWVARRSGGVSVLALVAVVLMYQVSGSSVEWLLTGSVAAALQDFKLGVPGMLLQVFGGYAVLKYLLAR